MFLQRLYAPVEALARASAPRFSVDTPPAPAQSDCDDPAISFDFDSDDQKRLPVTAEAAFVHAFAQERASLQAWCERAGWRPARVPALKILVSADYKISRALVPAWEGRAGVIEFPARRVGAGTAAIVHELTHVYFPSGNRFLAEGLAIYLQSVLGGNPAFPNFGRPLHAVARAHLAEIAPRFAAGDATALTAIDLGALDSIPTPNPLSLAAAQKAYAEEHRVQAALYAIAGSFVQFLIEAEGLARFRALYEQTPLLAGALDAGSPARWRQIYGTALGALEAHWQSLFIGMHPAQAAHR